MSLPWAFPELSDLKQLFAQIQVKDIIPTGILEILDNCSQHQKFAIGCSGGADSTFLTFLLFYNSRSYKIDSYFAILTTVCEGKIQD